MYTLLSCKVEVAGAGVFLEKARVSSGRLVSSAGGFSLRLVVLEEGRVRVF